MFCPGVEVVRDATCSTPRTHSSKDRSSQMGYGRSGAFDTTDNPNYKCWNCGMRRFKRRRARMDWFRTWWTSKETVICMNCGSQQLREAYPSGAINHNSYN
eukprot:g81623.t1